MNMISWFEIPVTGFERAKHFYEVMLGIAIEERMVGEARMGFMGDGSQGLAGALVLHAWYEPSDNGVLLYLNAGADLMPALVRAEAMGGTVLIPKTNISDEHGYMAVLRDTEGNRIALHSPH